MLDSNRRRPAFDRFWASLDPTMQAIFLDEATMQWAGLQEADGTPEEPVSVIDCMENVWDRWLDLPHYDRATLSLEDRTIAHALDAR